MIVNAYRISHPHVNDQQRGSQNVCRNSHLIMECANRGDMILHCEASGRASCRARWAEARIKIARMTLTIKLDGNWNSFQLANSAPPLSVTDSAIAPSARMVDAGFWHWRWTSTDVFGLSLFRGDCPSPPSHLTQWARGSTERWIRDGRLFCLWLSERVPPSRHAETCAALRLPSQ